MWKALLVGLPLISGYNTRREDPNTWIISGQVEPVESTPILEIRFAKPFSPGEDGERQRKVIVSALVGPAGEQNSEIDQLRFTEDSVQMAFRSIWATIAALNRVANIYLLPDGG